MSESHKTIVISLGGSLVVPDVPDADFVRSFVRTIQHKVDEGYRFLIIVGGGKTCRRYQDALTQIRENVSNDELDWLGIFTTQFNAQFVRLAFGSDAYESIVGDPYDVADIENSIMIAGGAKPGNSTDLGAVRAAEKLSASTVINMSNISHVYDSDPRANPDAEKFENLTWSQYRSFIPEEWSPGLSTPFDPIASKKAEELGVTVAIMNGDVVNLEQYLNTGSAEGTIIS